MNIRSDQDEYESKDTTLDSRPSTTDPTNATDTSKTAPVTNIKSIEKFLKDYYDTNIDHNHPDFPMIQEKVK